MRARPAITDETSPGSDGRPPSFAYGPISVGDHRAAVAGQHRMAVAALLTAGRERADGAIGTFGLALTGRQGRLGRRRTGSSGRRSPGGCEVRTPLASG